MLTFFRLQIEVNEWAKKNFGEQASWKLLMGAVEEMGELAHAHLKGEQGIRTKEDPIALGKDAVGDCLIYLANYCGARKWDLQAIIERTWLEVSQRNWKRFPQNGRTQ